MTNYKGQRPNTKNERLYCLLSAACCLLFTPLAVAASEYPLFITGAANPKDFEFFATGGWDGNWYVGYNRAWIIELPPVKSRDSYTRAFIGAKLGRAKDALLKEGVQNKIREKERNLKNLKEPLSEEQIVARNQLEEEIKKLNTQLERTKQEHPIVIGISSRPEWGKANSYFLVATRDIPFEGIPTAPLEGVGEARWFWAEVPIAQISKDTYNYIAVWSTDEMLDSASTSPIIASAWESEANRKTTGIVFGTPQQKRRIWLSETKGGPPTKLEKGISFYVPALGVKLIPPNDNRVEVNLISPADGSKLNQPQVVTASVKGKDISRVWVEIKSKKDWWRVSRFQYTPPYSFTLRDMKIAVPTGRQEGRSISLRVGAADLWENIGYSKPVNLSVK